MHNALGFQCHFLFFFEVSPTICYNVKKGKLKILRNKKVVLDSPLKYFQNSRLSPRVKITRYKIMCSWRDSNWSKYINCDKDKTPAGPLRKMTSAVPTFRSTLNPPNLKHEIEITKVFHAKLLVHFIFRPNLLKTKLLVGFAL